MTTSTEEVVDKAEAKRLAQQEGKRLAAIAERHALSDAGFPQGCDVVIDTPRQKEYHGRTGKVVEWNDGEIGVRVAVGAPAVWYHPHQLKRP